MSQGIDESTVRHIARLARLRLTDDEVRHFVTQLGAILDYIRQLERLDTRDVEPTAHPLPVQNVVREDEPAPPLGAERTLANAPRREAGFFALPKVLDQEDA